VIEWTRADFNTDMLFGICVGLIFGAMVAIALLGRKDPP
jgi:tetrahydromethanopterin S-methyltransferase subunit B